MDAPLAQLQFDRDGLYPRRSMHERMTTSTFSLAFSRRHAVTGTSFRESDQDEKRRYENSWP